jgi:long-chain acyl-CoA synthetase
MNIDFLLSVFRENMNKDAIIWQDKAYQYKWLIERIHFWIRELENHKLKNNEVVVLEADFTPESIALFLALIEKNCILVPLTTSVKNKKQKFIEIVQGERIITLDNEDAITIEKLPNIPDHDIYHELKKRNHPGLVLFSSGSTGENKASLHDLTGILEKFKIRKKTLRTIAFLLYDHIGGVNTMLYVLSNGGCMVTTADRKPESVLRLIEKYKVELLPTSPTFINLILISESYKNYDLSSLKIVTYGTEPMPENTLSRFHGLFPHITMQQTYGLSEIGILRSKSKSSDSLWVKVGGEGFKTRIVNGLLEIKAESAMLGYLNAPSPFTEDGWFITNDQVEQDGEYIKILGRKTEIINVGGEKVYPAEIENVILEIDFVKDCMVYGVDNIITGKTVFAEVVVKSDHDPEWAKNEIRDFCKKHLSKFKVPSRIKIVDSMNYSDRFKKIRK